MTAFIAPMFAKAGAAADRWRRAAAVAAAGTVLAASFLAPPALAQSEASQSQGPRHAHVSIDSLYPIVKEVLPAVVNVSVVMKGVPIATEQDFGPPSQDQELPELPQSPFDQFLRRFFGGEGFPRGQEMPSPGVKRIALGSGFIIDPAGYIVTNNHVVEQAKTITVVFQDNSRHPAKLVGRDARTDLALLKIDSPVALPYLEWGDSETAHVGDWVMAVGNPFGLGGTVTAGIISARGRDIESSPYEDFLQIDAPINRGNSGGPTFNMDGDVIGINTAIYTPTGGSVGIGFAIPADIAKPVIDQLRQHGRVERGWLGVQIQSVTPEIAKSLGRDNEHGALVVTVTADSPAAKAGVKPGDLILSFDGHAIDRPRDLSMAVAAAPIGKEAALTIWRDRKETELHPSIARMPQAIETAEGEQPSERPSTRRESAIGLELAPLTDALRQQLNIPQDVHGAVVTRVARDSPAADEIQPGDVIESINLHPVRNPREAADALQEAAKSNKNALILLNRQGTDEYIGLALG